MADKLPPGHGVDAHKDKMGKVMHEFKRGQLRSGTGRKGKKGKVVKNRDQAIAIGMSYHAEQLMAMGYSEEAAVAVASFIESQKAEEDAAEGPTGDIDSTPGKQVGNSGRQKQKPQEMASTFPTLPKQAAGSEDFDEGPMIKAKGRKCPPGTRPVGGGFCRNPRPGKRQYFEIEKGKSCPPGSRSAGKGRCQVNFAEAAAAAGTQSTACPPPKSDAEKQAAKAQRGTQPTKPQGADAGQQQQTPKVNSVQQSAETERKKQQREECKKMRGN